MKKPAAFLAVLLAMTLAGCALIRIPFATQSAAAQHPSASTAPFVTSAVNTLPTEKQILAAFEEIAFTSEYGNMERQVRKWTVKMNVAVHGEPTQDDLAALQRAMDGLNGIAGFPGVSIVTAGQNVNIWFVPLGKMPDVLPDYVQGNWGYFTTHFSNRGISDATIGIATDITKQNERNHLIFEELLQSTGLMQDLYDYPDSIYYGNWTTVQQPLPMDWEMLRMLYCPDLTPGMSEGDAMATLTAKYAPGR